MRIEEFEQTVSDQLTRIGGDVRYNVKPETRGYTLTLSVDSGQYDASKFYTETDVHLHSPQLIRTQVTNLYKCLIQKVLDTNLGKGVMYAS